MSASSRKGTGVWTHSSRGEGISEDQIQIERKRERERVEGKECCI